VLSPTFHPKVAKNDLRNLVNSFAGGWHVLRGRELKVAASESLEMLTTLLF
jgi:hypothetical protein